LGKSRTGIFLNQKSSQSPFSINPPHSNPLPPRGEGKTGITELELFY